MVGGLTVAYITTENMHFINCNLLKMEDIVIAGNCSELFDHPLKRQIRSCLLSFLYI